VVLPVETLKKLAAGIATKDGFISKKEAMKLSKILHEEHQLETSFFISHEQIGEGIVDKVDSGTKDGKLSRDEVEKYVKLYWKEACN
jgi:hypothetical protein